MCISSRILYCKIYRAFLVFILSEAFPVLAYAQSQEDEDAKYELEIIVTAKNPLPIIDIPRNVSVMDRGDIAVSGARNLPELMSRFANVNLNSFSGNSKATRVDIRGSGDTSVSNVLVLQDGFRINTPDLAGADYGAIPLYLVERVELVRGPNVVRYGEGASLGVVNIITRVPDRTAVGVGYDVGEGFKGWSSSAVGKFNSDHSIFVHVVKEQDEGYRDNNNLNLTSGLVGYTGRFFDSVESSLKLRSYKDDYRLPGPLSVTGLLDGSQDPKDSIEFTALGATTDDESLQLTNKIRIDRSFEIKLNGFYRDRDLQSSFNPDSPRIWGLISLNSRVGEFRIDWEPESVPFEMSAGLEYRENRYFRRPSRGFGAPQEILPGDTRSKAFYIYLESSYIRGSNVGLGYRKNSISSITSDTNNHWRNEAFEFSFVRSIGDESRLYLSAAKTFRAPNIDELNFQPTTNASGATGARLEAINEVGSLRPQTAERYEAGIKTQRESFGLDLTIFADRTSEEIIFRRVLGAGGNRNFNFPTPIKRKGVELAGSYLLSDKVDFGVQFGYTDAKISPDITVPLVSKYTGSVYFQYEPRESSTIYFSARYVDDRFDGNDFNNDDGTELEDYTISDLSFSQRFKLEKGSLRINLSLNNVFNESYIDLAYSGSGYPGQGRTYRFSVAISH